jgi:hypothetical protein
MTKKVPTNIMSRNLCVLGYGRVYVWVDTSGDQLLRPVVFPNVLSGAVYCRFLVNDVPVVLEHVPLHQQHTWFMHDETQPHFLCIVRQHLIQTSGEERIARGDPVNWPAPSPDLNPLNFWLWEHLKSLVYSAPISDLYYSIELRMPARRFE